MKYATAFLTFLYMILLEAATAQKPTIDTASSITSDPTSDISKMARLPEKWFPGVKKKDFFVFYKMHLPEGTKKGYHSATIGHYGNASLVWLNQIDEIEFAIAGIQPANKLNYVYHIVENDSLEVIPWSTPDSFRFAKDLPFAYLGKFDTRNKIMKLEIYKKTNYKDRCEIILNNLFTPAPNITKVVLFYNDRYLFSPHKQEYIPSDKQIGFNQKQWEEKRLTFDWSDSINHLLVQMQNTALNDMYTAYLIRKTSSGTDTAYISNRWEYTNYSPDPILRVNASFFNKPGDYKLVIVPEAPGEFRKNNYRHIASIPFTIRPSNTKFFSLRFVIGFGSTLLVIAGAAFLAYYLWNRRRLLAESREKELATMELRSVRAQLNPHFIFNALAGIQHLVNNGDTKGANHYLSKFARMTRNVLDDSNKEIISMSDEIRFLEDYLQMEQFRFGFNYSIDVDGDIDRNETELPSMLLQPYIENAVKHGVSRLKGEGSINISFKKKEDSLVIEVQDNGHGHTDSPAPQGMGWKLCEDRIKLLNRLHRKMSISLKKHSDNNGTLISIMFNNWLPYARSNN